MGVRVFRRRWVCLEGDGEAKTDEPAHVSGRTRARPARRKGQEKGELRIVQWSERPDRDDGA